MKGHADRAEAHAAQPGAVVVERRAGRTDARRLGIATLQCPEGLFCKDVQTGVSDPAGSWRAPDTGEFARPGSVTESTTKLLRKEEENDK